MDLCTYHIRYLSPTQVLVLWSPHITFYSYDLGMACANFPGKKSNENIKSMYGILGNAQTLKTKTWSQVLMVSSRKLNTCSWKSGQHHLQIVLLALFWDNVWTLSWVCKTDKSSQHWRFCSNGKLKTLNFNGGCWWARKWAPAHHSSVIGTCPQPLLLSALREREVTGCDAYKIRFLLALSFLLG